MFSLLNLQLRRPSLQRISEAIWYWLNNSQWVVPVSFLIFIFVFIPFWQAFLYNFDEGFELMRATMQNQGYSLYKEIWSDQPPLFSDILKNWLLVFGNSIFFARFLIILFATTLLLFFYKTLRLFFGHWSAIFGTALLVFTTDFIQFSIQVKVDMPALTLVVVMLYFLMFSLHQDGNRRFKSSAAIAGFFMGLALQTKLYTVLVCPAIALYFLLLLILSWRQTEKRKVIFVKGILFGGGLAVSILLSILFYREAAFGQLVESHLSAKQFFEDLTFKKLIHRSFTTNPAFWIFSSLGLGLVGTQERWRIYFPILWLVATLLVLANHTPLWPHYYLLMALPIAWIGSAVFFQLWRSLATSENGRPLLRKSWRENTIHFRLNLVAIILVFGIHILGTTSVYVRGRHAVQQTSHGSAKQIALEHVLTYQANTNWFVTDSPIYAFYADLKIPPELVVISRKRVLTEGINGEFILEMIHKYEPEQVLLERFVEERFDPPFLAYQPLADYLKANYVEMTGDDKGYFEISHFISKSILN